MRRLISTMAQQASPRRFAPLQQGIAADQMSSLPKLKGVVFDVDGTLWYVYSCYLLCYVFVS